ELMIELVTTAEEYLKERGAFALDETTPSQLDAARRERVVALRSQLSAAAGAPLVLATVTTPRTAAFLARDDFAAHASRGPMTPDHVIRTKRIPMIGSDVAAYAEEYARYFERNAVRSREPLTMLDPAPRVVLDRDLGLLTAGRTGRDAAIARDIFL